MRNIKKIVEINGINTSDLKVLSKEEMDELFKKFKEGDTQAKEKIATGNLRLVLSIIKKYNNGKNDWITLYTLMCHSFNHQFRFNNQHQYNSSFGKNRGYFSDRQRKDLYDMKKTISTDIAVVSKSFADIDYSDFDENDLLYFDPPYFNSVGNYNDGKRGFEGWTEQHEKQLLELLDKLNEQGTRFALSNNLKYENPMLEKWKNKYRTHFLKGDYVNCNYHKIDRSKDCEVLITNY